MASPKLILSYLGSALPYTLTVNGQGWAINKTFVSGSNTYDITPFVTLSQLNQSAQFQALLAAGTVSVAYQSGSATDIAGLDDAGGHENVFSVAFTSGTSGAADTAFTVPFSCTLLDSFANITTAFASGTVQVWTAAGGTGTALTDAFSTTATGIKRETTLAASPALTAGQVIYFRVSDASIRGRLSIIVVR